ncbi:MAG: copper resistance protein B [Pseudomonadales bacterium]|nr:copper resistance protein B [Pseudomonadales bacterium]
MQKIKIFQSVLLASTLSLAANSVDAGGEDDPLLTKVLIDQFELRDSDSENPLVLEGQAWIGKDLHKLWLKTDFERVEGETEDAELQVLYSRAIAPFWDLQLGLRKDFQPSPSRSWAVIGLQGLAPYFFEVEPVFFIGESGRTALRLEAEYELLLTQRLILTPDIELNIYGQNDSETGVGSGLSDVQMGLRLRYEIRREFAPYIGVNWSRKYGKTADYSRRTGEDLDDTQLVIGIRAWF